MQYASVKNFAWGVTRLVGNERANYPKQLAVETFNAQTISFIRECNAKTVAEIGIYKGDTSLEIARICNELHLFDYADKCETVAERLKDTSLTNFKTFGCSYKLLDSYNWNLAKLIEQNNKPIYDYVYIDGAHTFAVDALTFFLCDKLLKIGGHIDFDDFGWTLAGSPALNPRVFPLTSRLYTAEQIHSKQVAMILDVCVRRDHRYREVVPNKIFQKIS